MELTRMPGRQALLEALNKSYQLLKETEDFLIVTTNPTERARLELECEKYKSQIADYEENLDKLPPADEPAIIKAYLAALWQKFEAEASLQPIKLVTWASEATVPGSRRNLQRLEAFLEAEETIEFKLPNFQTDKLSLPKLKEVDIEDFLVAHTRIVLLGAPGSGKTMAMWRLARIFGQAWDEAAPIPLSVNPLPPEWRERIPVFAQLEHWKDPETTLVAFLQAEIEDYATPEFAELLPNLMKEGRVVLLLDGLDEIPDLERDEKTGLISDPRARAITGLSYYWREVGCVQSCRLKDAGSVTFWPSLQMGDLGRPQVAAFAAAYYHNSITDQAEADSLTQGLLAGLYREGCERLQDLVTKPAYLVRLLDYYQLQKEEGQPDTVALPNNPVRLIKFSVNETLDAMLACQRISDSEATDLPERLSYLAFNLIEADQLGAVNKEQAATWLFQVERKPARPGINVITHQQKASLNRLWTLAEDAYLITETEANIEFHCLALQQYFCALYFMSRPFDGAFLEQITNPRYKEIWSVWAKIDKTRNVRSELVSLLSNEAGSKVCWDVTTALSYLSDDKTVDLLAGLITNDNNRVRNWVVTALGRLGNPHAVSPLNEVLKFDEDYRVRSSAAIALSELGDTALEPLLNALQDKNSEVRFSIVVALGKLGNTKALPILDWVQTHDTGKSLRGDISVAAAQAIAQINQSLLVKV